MPMTQSGELFEKYAAALAQAYAEAAGREATDVPVSIEALKQFFATRFKREAYRLPPDGREEFLSAVAYELLARLERAEVRAGGSAAELEESFRRATLTVLDTVRHRIMRAQVRTRLREYELESTDTLQRGSLAPDLDGVLQRDLIAMLSPDDAIVLYLVTQGMQVDAISKQMNVSKRTIYRALRTIRELLEEHRNG
jgi:hypothetical protein